MFVLRKHEKVAVYAMFAVVPRLLCIVRGEKKSNLF